MVVERIQATDRTKSQQTNYPAVALIGLAGGLLGPLLYWLGTVAKPWLIGSGLLGDATYVLRDFVAGIWPGMVFRILIPVKKLPTEWIVVLAIVNAIIFVMFSLIGGAFASTPRSARLTGAAIFCLFGLGWHALLSLTFFNFPGWAPTVTAGVAAFYWGFAWFSMGGWRGH